MPWNQLFGHEANINRFRNSLNHQRMASTYLFVGMPGIGKRLFAQLLAEALLCENSVEPLTACGTCSACQQVHSNSHPDLISIEKPNDKAFIPVELFIGDKEHRRQVGLVHDIGLKPFRGGRKIAVVDDADFLNQEGANSLLKTLEEPPPGSILILIGTSEQQQLQTIISRSQIIRFDPLTTDQVRTVLSRLTDLDTEISLDVLSAASEGSIQLALQLADSDVYEFRQQLVAQLATADPGQNDFAKTIIGFVDAAGKESVKKRERLVMIADFAIGFYRNCYRELIDQDQGQDFEFEFPEEIKGLLRRWSGFDELTAAEIAGHAIERTIELQSHVHANANQANAVDAWLSQLRKISMPKAPATR